ncbi:MAG: 4Fe-4S binding protein [Candidatus Helarchaeota archaeon]
MTQVDYYEIVRNKLKVGPLGAPKHKKVLEFLKIIWTEEEAKLLSHLEGVRKLITPRKLAKITGMEKAKVKEILERCAEKGTILKIGNQFGLLPLVPGIFEMYYLKRKDSTENQKKAAKVFREIIDKVLPSMLLAADTPIFRPKLPVDAKEKTIKIDKSIEAKSQVLPFELVEEMINRNDYYAAIPCQCRLIGELSGDPCTVAPADIGCFVTGKLAKQLVAQGIGKELNKDEAIDYLKRAEKAGLVHNGGDVSESITHSLICNCCNCHCGGLLPAAKYGVPAIKQSNFAPKINEDLCIKCETCIKKCPMNAIFHKFPIKADNSDEKILIKYDNCIGCGVCATNCPREAIIMEKVRENPTIDLKKFGIDPSFLNLLGE